MTSGAAARLGARFVQQVLPVWATHGFRAETGLFVEQIDVDGAPARDAPVRLRVQTRQTAVFAQAALRGWMDRDEARRRAEAGAAALLRSFRLDEGYGRRASSTGAVMDACRDLYDHAFVIFAFAWTARALDEPAWLGEAEAVWRFLETAMGHEAGGFVEALPSNGHIRRQNPHMHLLEACLTACEAGDDGRWRARAEVILDLFHKVFCRPDGGLREHFGADWGPVHGGALSHREPGHHYEWAWLLQRARALLNWDDLGARSALLRFAERYGREASRGLVLDRVTPAGARAAHTARLWPQCESARARAAAGDRDGADADAARIIVHYLDRGAHGCWADYAAIDGHAPPPAPAPASSLYHLTGAVAAFEDSRLSPLCPR